MSLLYTTSLNAYGAVVSDAHSIVIALWSFALDELHQERFFSSQYIPTRPSTPIPYWQDACLSVGAKILPSVSTLH